LKNIDNPETRIAGYLYENGILMLLVATPIQTSEGLGPVPGVVVWARYIYDANVQELALRTQLCLTFYPIASNTPIVKSYASAIANIPPIGFTIATPEWTNNNAFALEQLPASLNDLQGRQCWMTADANLTGSARYSALGVLPDLFGNKVVIVRTDINRRIQNLGGISLGLSLGMVSLVVIVATVIILFYIERALLHPLALLSSRFNAITKSKDVSVRIKQRNGSDELATTVTNINVLLTSIFITHRKLEYEQVKLEELLEKTGVEEQRARAIMNAIPDFILCVRATGIVHHANSAFLTAFSLSSSEVNGVINVEGLFVETTFVDLQEQCQKGELIEREMHHNQKAKIPVMVAVTPITLFLDDQPTSAFVVFARNLSESKALTSSLEAERKRLVDLEQNAEFESLWHDKRRKRHFVKYCSQNLTEENIKFLDAVEDYKSQKNQQKRQEMQKKMHSQFLIPGKSPYELKLDERLLKDVALVESGFGQLDLFDDFAVYIRGQVMSDLLPKFLEWEREHEGTGTDTETDTDLMTSTGSMDVGSTSYLSAVAHKSQRSSGTTLVGTPQ
jgi:PAS domain-containing protein